MIIPEATSLRNGLEISMTVTIETFDMHGANIICIEMLQGQNVSNLLRNQPCLTGNILDTIKESERERESQAEKLEKESEVKRRKDV